MRYDGQVLAARGKLHVVHGRPVLSNHPLVQRVVGAWQRVAAPFRRPVAVGNGGGLRGRAGVGGFLADVELEDLKVAVAVDWLLTF